MTASTLAPRPPTTPRQRRPWAARLVAGLVVAAPTALATAVLLHPNDTTDAADTLGRIADAERARWIAVHLLEPVAWLALAAVLLLAATIRVGRARWPVRVGALMAAAGAVGAALIVYGHGEAYRFMTEPGMDLAAMEPLYDHFNDDVPMAAVFAGLFQPGMLVLGIGLWRARAVPRWAAALIALTPVTMLVTAGAAPAVGAIVIGLPMIAGLAGSARTIAQAADRGTG